MLGAAEGDLIGDNAEADLRIALGRDDVRQRANDYIDAELFGSPRWFHGWAERNKVQDNSPEGRALPRINPKYLLVLSRRGVPMTTLK